MDWGLLKNLCGQKCGQKFVVYRRKALLSHKTLDSGRESGIRTEYLTH